MLFSTQSENAQLAFVIERLREIHLSLDIEGCISVLDDEDNIWITPEEFLYDGEMENEMIMYRPNEVTEDIESNHKFIFLHSEIYKNNVGIRSIIQVSSPEVIAQSNDINYGIFHMLPLYGPHVGTLSIEELTDFTKVRAIKTILEDLKDESASIILKNYGLLCTDLNLQQALFKVENIQQMLRLFALTKAAESKKVVSSDIIDQVLNHQPEIFDTLRGRKSHFDYTPFQNQLRYLMQVAVHEGWTTSNRGSFSMRVNDDTFFISSGQENKACLSDNSLMLVRGVKMEANKGVDPFFQLHYKIMKKNPEIQVVAMVEPIHLMAMNIGNIPFSFTNPHPFYNFAGRLLNLPLESITSPDLIANQISIKQDALIIDNGFILVTGKTTDQVLTRISTLENLAKIYYQK